MPEIKRTFQAGRMNKDLDERIIPKNEYVDAMNIQVSTSEDSEVGTAQNILGNKEIEGPIPSDAITIGVVSDEKIDALYYLIWSKDAHYIVAYYKGSSTPTPILVDLNLDVLRFDPNMIITGINVIDDMLFWTDNRNEPKKINIPRCRTGTNNDWNTHTKLINESQSSLGWSNIDIEEKHITVIKKAPVTPLSMRLEKSRDPNKIYTGVITISADDSIDNSFPDTTIHDFSGFSVDDTFAIEITAGLVGNTIQTIGPVGSALPTNPGLTGWHDGIGVGQGAIPAGTKIVFKPFNENGTAPGIPVTDYVIKGIVENVDPSDPAVNTYNDGILVRILSIDGYPPTTPDEEDTLNYVVDLFEETENLFEFKFPRFSYRYKYEDGEYSPFGPFTQVAFAPGAFDYHPRKGYNIGMTNNITKVHLSGLVNDFTPKDVVSVDILFKDEPSPVIYIVDTIRADNVTNLSSGNNMWQSLLQQGAAFTIKSETINGVVPSNQLLRPWDNIPRKALAQDVTGSRIVYGNYVQNYDLLAPGGEKYVADFTVNWHQDDTYDMMDGLIITDENSGVGKSIKSLREYQLGVVFTDKYGRETPVISNTTGSIKLEKDRASLNNRLQVNVNNQLLQSNLTSIEYFKFYIKETAGEYYNMAMDRFYDAEDSNIWLSFPSSDRNKIDIDTFLILKKGSESDDLIADAARYKVIAIENEAPDFIKTTRMKASSVTHNSSTNPIFESGSTGNAPVIGEDEFELSYNAYHGTAGQNLHTYTEGELYIEFGKTGETEVSKRYKIASISTNWDGTSADLADAKYSIKLAETLDSDVNFITDDPTGTNSNEIENGAIVNIYKYKVENKPQFDGKFFVKIFSDDIFRTNISLSFADGLDLRVTESRQVYYMDENQHARHTSDLNNFLTDGYSNNDGTDFNPITEEFDNIWGYYANDEFASFALYFRRYNKSNFIQSAPAIGMNDVSTGPNDPRPVLQHLSLGNSAMIPAMASSFEDVDVSYLDEDWGAQEYWYKEYGAYGTGQFAWQQGYTANFQSNSGLASINPPTYANEGVGAYIENTDHTSQSDNPRDTEVWFIDAGPYKGYRTTDNDLYFDGVDVVDTLDTNNTSETYEAGITLGGGYWGMELAFGGIFGSKHHTYWPTVNPEIEGFFNVGDWNNTGGAASNPKYIDAVTKDFVNSINTGYRFRWREDPTKTVYTIDSVAERRKLRHSDLRFKEVYPVPSIASENANRSMAEAVSFNFTKGWGMTGISPGLGGTSWNPVVDGPVQSGLKIKLQAVDSAGGNTGDSCPPAGFSDDVIIFVSTLSGDNSGGGDATTARIHKGMALEAYTTGGTNSDLATHLGGQDYLVVRYIEKLNNGTDDYFALYLGGYNAPMSGIDHLISDTRKPDLGVSEGLTFVQVGMNGYSPNSEFNINTMLNNSGAIGAVGYRMEFVEDVEPEEIISENPAIFETEPKEIKELDIYYEASGAIPIVLKSSNVHEAFPLNSFFMDITSTPNNLMAHVVVGYNGLDLIVDSPTTGFIPSVANVGGVYDIYLPDRTSMQVQITGVTDNTPVGQSTISINPNLYNNKVKLSWHNCYSFGNGVESNRIRDNFNLPFISNGVKVSTTLEYDYEEEHRKYGLIYSGIYNSVSGVNDTNQFIAAEKITKDINPIYGSIQKLHSRDSDLVTLCEDKVLRIQANKDALFNADGSSNVTASSNVLGQAIPFSGEYGISTNPESFASESYRAYFSDKVRGTIMRLSKDGLTPISDHGMKDWFRDNLKICRNIIGSYDDRNDEYNVKVEKYYLTDLSGQNSGWINNRGNGTNINIQNIIAGGGVDEESGINYTVKDESKVLSFKEDVKGWVSFKSFTDMQLGVSMANDYYTFKTGKLYKHYDETGPRNTFYSTFTPSSVDVVLNEAPSFTKVFHTINYEGSKAKVDKFKNESIPYLDDSYDMTPVNYSDQEYYNLSSKKGWYLESITTDKEDGYINEFLEKESKWFNYVKKQINTCLQDADTGDFSFQGIGIVSGYNPMIPADSWPDDPLGDIICTPETILDTTITTFDIGGDVEVDEDIFEPDIIVIDDGIGGGGQQDSGEDGILDGDDSVIDTDFDDGIINVEDPIEFDDPVEADPDIIDDFQTEIEIYGCTDPTAFNYNPNATIDDGDCVAVISGCTDPNAFNYNADANINTGCLYLGCIDPTAINYNPNAIIGCDITGSNACCEYDTGSGESGGGTAMGAPMPTSTSLAEIVTNLDIPRSPQVTSEEEEEEELLRIRRNIRTNRTNY